MIQSIPTLPEGGGRVMVSPGERHRRRGGSQEICQVGRSSSSALNQEVTGSESSTVVPLRVNTEHSGERSLVR